MLRIAVFTSVLFCCVLPAQTTLTKRAGNYEFTLRLPGEGFFSLEETEVPFRVNEWTDGGAGRPVRSARIRAVIDMPAMRGMPKFEQLAHSHGVPGEYGVHPTFPHGGEYRLSITILSAAEEPQGLATVEFPLQVEDATAESRKRASALPNPWELQVETSPAHPKAGEQVELRLSIAMRNTIDRRNVTDFEEVHEKRMHLFLVRSDFGEFAHEHPELRPGGVFVLQYTFPTGGFYRIFVDVAPRDAGSQILVAHLSVDGKVTNSYDIYSASTADRGLKQSIDGVTLEVLDAAVPLPCKRTVTLTMKLLDKEGKPLEDLQPYLGAMGHLFLVNQDTETFVHSHPDDRTPIPEGTLPFLARFPKPGLYRGWVQFQRNGKVETAKFIVQAE